MGRDSNPLFLDGWFKPLSPCFYSSAGGLYPIPYDPFDPNHSCPGFILVARYLGRVMKSRKVILKALFDESNVPDRTAFFQANPEGVG